MLGDGNGWVIGPAGERRWGRYGAAGLLIRAVGESGQPCVLLQHRAAWTANGDTWAVTGGARDSHETAVEAALRETSEEAGISASDLTIVGQVVNAELYDSAHELIWSYTTVVADAASLLPTTMNNESVELRWVNESEVSSLNLLPAFADAWENGLRTQPATLVVDAREFPELPKILTDPANFPFSVMDRTGANHWVTQCTVLSSTTTAMPPHRYLTIEQQGQEGSDFPDSQPVYVTRQLITHAPTVDPDTLMARTAGPTW